MLESEEADMLRPGEQLLVPQRPPNMDIRIAVAPTEDSPFTPPLGPTRHPGTPLGGEHVLPEPAGRPIESSSRRRINEVGDAVPGGQEPPYQGSQDSDLAARVERQLAVAPIASLAHIENQPIGRRRRREDSTAPRWQGLQCCMCIGADAIQAHDSRGLMMHLVRAHLGQALAA